jgi:hypothetical protein
MLGPNEEINPDELEKAKKLVEALIDTVQQTIEETSMPGYLVMDAFLSVVASFIVQSWHTMEIPLDDRPTIVEMLIEWLKQKIHDVEQEYEA